MALKNNLLGEVTAILDLKKVSITESSVDRGMEHMCVSRCLRL